MQQIYGRTPIAKCNFNKAAHPQGFAIQVCWSRLNLLEKKYRQSAKIKKSLDRVQIEFPSKGDRGVQQ